MSHEWILQVELDASLEPAALAVGKGKFGKGATRSWSIRPSLPLASEHNLETLRTTLQRQVQDLFFFVKGNSVHGQAKHVEQQASTQPAALRFLDPSCTPLELHLHDGSTIFATLQPMQFAASASQHFVAVPQALYRFAGVGSALELTGQSSRRVVRIGDDGWTSGIAMGNAPLGSLNECASVTFRISMTPLKARGHSVMNSAGQSVDADGNRLPPEVGDVIPTVAVGLCDGSVDVDSPASAFGSHSKCWLLNTVTGALHAGTRQMFVDHQQYRAAPTVTITITVDQQRGSIFLIQNGRHIGGFTVSKYLADNLFPCVELYSRGATVEIL
jgi:uncharacterized protein (DUF779 family)